MSVSSATVQEVDWYDYPQYYDLLFQDETEREVAFIEAACAQYVPGRVKRLVEPGCGSGRLVHAFAARGYHVTGIDLNPVCLKFVDQRLARKKLKGTTLRADMCDFQLAKPADAAFCTMNTFRHLLKEEDARRHLESVAAALRPGGIYVLGFHLLPPDVDDECTERWTAFRGRTKITGTLRVLSTDRRRRREHLRVTVSVRSARRTLRMRSEFDLRRYTAPQFRKLIESVPQLELRDVYDFRYDLEEPQEFDNELCDSVFILQRV